MPDIFAAALQKQELPDGRVALDGFNSMSWRSGHLEFANRTAEVMTGVPDISRLLHRWVQPILPRKVARDLRVL